MSRRSCFDRKGPRSARSTPTATPSRSPQSFVWQVADTSRAVYAVDDYDNFVRVQAESALRHVATTHPYDDPGDEVTSLRGSVDVVAAELAREVAQRVVIAGVEIVEVRISHLAYASEIARAMLRRQQANAVVAARSRIVEGAVRMVDLALSRLDERGIVELDEEPRARHLRQCGRTRREAVDVSEHGSAAVARARELRPDVTWIAEVHTVRR